MLKFEPLSPHLERAYLHNKRMVVYKFSSAAHPVIDHWFEDFLAHLQNASPDKPFLMLCDVSHANLVLNPYVRTRTVEMTQQRPEIPGRIAAVVGKSISGHLLKGFFRLLNSSRNQRQREVFFTVEEAVRWLEEALPR